MILNHYILECLIIDKSIMNILFLKIVFTIFLIVNIYSCTNRNTEMTNNQSQVKFEIDKYIGSWQLVEIGTFNGNNFIEINNDGNFCYIFNEKDSTFGIWHVTSNETIVLTNDSSDYSGHRGFCLFIYDCEDPVEYLKRLDTIVSIKNSPYKHFVFFDNENFKFTNDSLIYIHKEHFTCKDSLIFIKIYE